MKSVLHEAVLEVYVCIRRRTLTIDDKKICIRFPGAIHRQRMCQYWQSSVGGHLNAEVGTWSSLLRRFCDRLNDIAAERLARGATVAQISDFAGVCRVCAEEENEIETLIAAALRNDQKAFEALFTTLRPPIDRPARQKLWTVARAQDLGTVVQRTSPALFLRLKLFRVDGSIFAFAHPIAVFQTWQYLRSEERDRLSFVDLLAEATTLAFHIDLHQRVEPRFGAGELLEQLTLKLEARLSPQEHFCYDALYHCRLTSENVAVRVGIPEPQRHQVHHRIWRRALVIAEGLLAVKEQPDERKGPVKRHADGSGEGPAARERRCSGNGRTGSSHALTPRSKLSPFVSSLEAALDCPAPEEPNANSGSPC